MVLKATRSNILRLFWLSHLIDWKYFSFPKRLSLKWKQSCWCNEVYLKASSYVWKRFWRTTKITKLKTGDFYYNILTIILQNDFILKDRKFSCRKYSVLSIRFILLKTFIKELMLLKFIMYHNRVKALNWKSNSIIVSIVSFNVEYFVLNSDYKRALVWSELLASFLNRC